MPDDNKLNAAYQADNFFLFRKLLKRSSCHFVLQNGEDVHKNSLLFDESLSVFEKILSSDKETNAKYICLIWEECELWKKKELLTWKRNEDHGLPVHFVLKSTNTKNLLSFLVYDWHNPQCHMANKEIKYFLELKNKQMVEEKNGKSLFQKLYDIIEVENVYHEVCLRIIYEYL